MEGTAAAGSGGELYEAIKTKERKVGRDRYGI